MIADPQILTQILLLESIFVVPLTFFTVFLFGRDRDDRYRAALAALQAKNEELEKKLAEYEALNRDLQKKLRHLEEEYSRKIEQEIERVREEYERKLKEAQRVSKVALTIVEALRLGIVKLVDVKNECMSIVVEPGQILCKADSKTMKVIYPESREVGEEIIVIESEKR